MLYDAIQRFSRHRKCRRNAAVCSGMHNASPRRLRLLNSIFQCRASRSFGKAERSGFSKLCMFAHVFPKESSVATNGTGCRKKWINDSTVFLFGICASEAESSVAQRHPELGFMRPSVLPVIREWLLYFVLRKSDEAKARDSGDEILLAALYNHSLQDAAAGKRAQCHVDETTGCSSARICATKNDAVEHTTSHLCMSRMILRFGLWCRGRHSVNRWNVGGDQ